MAEPTGGRGSRRPDDTTDAVRIIPDSTNEPALRFASRDDTSPLQHWTEAPTGESARVGSEDADTGWTGFASPSWSDQAGDDDLSDLRARLNSSSDDPADPFPELSVGARTGGFDRPPVVTRDVTGDTGTIDLEDTSGTIDLSDPPTVVVGAAGKPAVTAISSRRSRLSASGSSGGNDTTGGIDRPLVIGGSTGTPGSATAPETADPTGDPFAATKGTGGRDMGMATLVGVGFVVVAALAFRLGSDMTNALVTVVLFGCGLDYFSRLRQQGLHPASLIGVAAVAAAPVAGYHRGEGGLLFVLALGVLGTLLWYIVVDRESPVILSAGATIIGIGWLGGLGGYGGILAALPQREGIAIIVAVAVAVVLVDVVGLLVGSTMGRNPMAPAISPSKTWEGTLGGVVAAVVFSVVLTYQIAPLDERWQHPFQIGLLCAIAAVLGGLASSLIKRDLRIKDWGNLLPGHGGVLDRFDGFVFALPVAYYLCRVLNIAGL
jgi:CDP-diglyceride synthetase